MSDPCKSCGVSFDNVPQAKYGYCTGCWNHHVADVISSFVNGAGDKDYDEVAEFIVNDHRTLQQNTFKLMVACMKRWAKAAFDLRNEATVKTCQKIIEANPDLYLPYV